MTAPSDEAADRRVLITGVGSTLGRRLTAMLLADDRVARVVGVGEEPDAPRMPGSATARFTYRQVNLLKRRELTALFRSNEFRSGEIDTVVHLAFLHRPEFTSKATHRLNVEGTKHFLDECLAQDGVRKFVFRSSGMVYKLEPHGPVELREGDDLNFDSDRHPIIKDEVDAELLCRAKMDNGRMRIVVLRPSAVVGPGMHTYFNVYLESKVTVRVAGYDPMINIVHVQDVVRAIQLSIFEDVQGIYNVDGLETLPLSELIRRTETKTVPVPEALAVRANRAFRRLRLTRFHADVDIERLKYSCVLDASKARRELGYEPVHRYLTAT